MEKNLYYQFNMNNTQTRMQILKMEIEANPFTERNSSRENFSVLFRGNFSLDSSFLNPFNDTVTRVLFIVCYGAVFLMCVLGKFD